MGPLAVLPPKVKTLSIFFLTTANSAKPTGKSINIEAEMHLNYIVGPKNKHRPLFVILFTIDYRRFQS